MPIKDNREYRNLGTFQAGEDTDTVTGYASTFDEYELFEFEGVKYYERIDPHAFDGADLSDVVFLRDHTGRVLARTKNGSVELSIDEHGLHQRSNLGLTAASREMLEDIRTGLYSQMSFSFVIAEGGDHVEGRTRVIDRVAKVYDVSAVAFPANPYTDIGVSMRDRFNGVIEAEKAERLERERRARLIKRNQLRIKLATTGQTGGTTDEH